LKHGVYTKPNYSKINLHAQMKFHSTWTALKSLDATNNYIQKKLINIFSISHPLQTSNLLITNHSTMQQLSSFIIKIL